MTESWKAERVLWPYVWYEKVFPPKHSDKEMDMHWQKSDPIAVARAN